MRYALRATIAAVAVAALCSISLATVGVPQAHAARGHVSSSGPNVPPPVQCLEVDISSLSAIDTNSVQPQGLIVNNCGFTVSNGRLHIDGYAVCDGVSSNGADTTTFPPLPNGQYQPFTGTITSVCEVCQDGKAVAFPPFEVYAYADASGVGPNNTPVEDTGTAEQGPTDLTNSPSYSVPCP